MLPKKSKDIGSCKYTVTMLGAIKGREVLTKLAKLIAPALEGMDGKEFTEASMARMLGKLLKELNTNDISYFCEAFTENTEVLLPDGKAPYLHHIFDEHFAGKYLEMTKWLIFCIEVNFGNFFVEALRSASQKSAVSPASKESEPQSQSISTGTSGAS